LQTASWQLRGRRTDPVLPQYTTTPVTTKT
jgi:hypothetical protein